MSSAPRFRRDVENMIAEMRGLPLDESRSRPRETKTAADLMNQLLLKYRIGMCTPEEAIRQAWTEVVGAPNATMCQPLRIERNRALVVAVSNPVVRQELLFHKKLVLERVRAIPAAKHIDEIVFRAG